MKERGILFSAPMVRALLDGSKTQTRRALREQPASAPHAMRAFLTRCGSRPVFAAVWDDPAPDGSTMCLCPYGVPGDRLWVREAFRFCTEFDASPPRDSTSANRIWHETDAPHQPGAGKLRPGMFMPRWASRLVLEVLDVRVERLHAISEADAMAEGIEHSTLNDPRIEYRWLWESINGAGSWDANPWVWAVGFGRA